MVRRLHDDGMMRISPALMLLVLAFVGAVLALVVTGALLREVDAGSSGYGSVLSRW